MILSVVTVPHSVGFINHPMNGAFLSVASQTYPRCGVISSRPKRQKFSWKSPAEVVVNNSWFPARRHAAHSNLLGETNASEYRLDRFHGGVALLLVRAFAIPILMHRKVLQVRACCFFILFSLLSILVCSHLVQLPCCCCCISCLFMSPPPIRVCPKLIQPSYCCFGGFLSAVAFCLCPRHPILCLPPTGCPTGAGRPSVDVGVEARAARVVADISSRRRGVASSCRHDIPPVHG